MQTLKSARQRRASLLMPRRLRDRGGVTVAKARARLEAVRRVEALRSEAAPAEEIEAAQGAATAAWHLAEALSPHVCCRIHTTTCAADWSQGEPVSLHKSRPEARSHLVGQSFSASQAPRCRTR